MKDLKSSLLKVCQFYGKFEKPSTFKEFFRFLELTLLTLKYIFKCFKLQNIINYWIGSILLLLLHCLNANFNSENILDVYQDIKIIADENLAI